MKQMVCVLCSLSLAGCLLAGCTSSAGQNFGDALQDWDPKLSPPSDANPVSYENGQFGDRLGFNVVSYPKGSSLYAHKFFVINEAYAQIEFADSEGRALVLRVAPADAGTLTTTYGETHTTSDSTRTAEGIEVRTRGSSEGCSMVTWERDGYQFLLHSNKAQGALPEAEVDEVVRDTRAEAA